MRARLSAARAAWAMPRDLLARVRWLFLLACLIAGVTLLPQLVVAPTATPLRLLAAAAATTLCWRWVRCYRCGAGTPLWEPAEAALLGVIALAVGPLPALGPFYVGLYYRALYPSAPRTAVRTLAYLAAFLGAVHREASPLSHASAEVVGQVFGFVLSATVMHVVARALVVQERAVQREQTLREASAALVSATTRDEVHVAALEAFRLLLHEIPAASINIKARVDDTLVAVAACGDRAEELLRVRTPLSALSAASRAALLAGQSVDLSRVAPATQRALGYTPKTGTIFITPLFIQEALKGTITITADARLPADLTRIVPVLGAQVALALESVARAADLYHRQGEQRFRALVQHASDLILVVDPTGVISYVSPSIAHVLGHAVADVDGANWLDLLHPDDAAHARRVYAELATTPGAAVSGEVRARHRDGSWRTLEVNRANLLDEPGVEGFVVNARDITDRARMAEAARASAASLADAQRIAHLGDWWRDIDTGEAHWSDEMYRLHGFAPGEAVLETRLADLTHPDDRERVRAWMAAVIAGRATSVEHRILRPDGTVRHLQQQVELVRDAAGHPRRLVGIALDITERKTFEEQLRHQAFHDPLTGLPNRALFLDRVERALAHAGRQSGSVGVLFLDLDRFKVINDSLGHAAGDQLLVAVAARLAGCVRAEDTVARLGGDEFAVLLADLAGLDAATRTAARIIRDLDTPFRLDGHDVITAASIGLVTRGTDGTDGAAAELLRDADVALYRAKAAGRGRYEVFDAAMNAQALERLQLEVDLRRALERGEFAVYYQPKVALATGRLAGMEALVRWHSPTRGLVPPGAFIPLAEETGLINLLGQWVLEEACRQARRWNAATDGADRVVVSVNLSARQFAQPTLVDDVARALRESGVTPCAVQLEITESVAMGDAEATVATLQRLKGLGVELAIDDFGTGYSSLAYLRRFPLDAVKIDRVFISGLQDGGEGSSIIAAMVGLGRGLGLAVVAEGVETTEEARQLDRLGCAVGQGYYWAKPLPPERADAFIRQRWPRVA